VGQVPGVPSYLIVGNGRLSRHLQHLFTLESIPFERWHRSCAVTFDEVALRARSVVVAISDDAIEEFVARHATDNRQIWIHCSGALTTPLAECAHPLMLFGEELYDLDTYRRIPFVCERGRRPFPELFPELSNPFAVIAPEHKPLYHALCVIGGNFTTLLWQKVLGDGAQRLGLDRELFYPYMEQVVRNLEGSGDPLTGPLARGDWRTVERHLRALAGDPFRQVYEAFVEAYRADAVREAS
jgi:predicted short-subunit dehydrogenase-like oxidoreductase (DUF2520 family)